ncbi:uncharacterized protein LOC105283154 [Ooceraea biroi]|uniref:Zinc finger CW-type PWWP domain protein n=1 Tax=Ooceraea biroi TaxID=2015173 RepID=A0A026W4Q3_OOCBI|nr:uncharacterized protein LOC105283154 [Ooceraea biroi]EZA51060.1 Zinc finger CW-type PWWP domain protein [Ooceraea biroi]
MALGDPPSRDSRDDSEHRRRQAPMLLFEGDENPRKRVDNFKTAAASQSDRGSSFQFPSSSFTPYDELFVVISPGVNKRATPVPPNAPIKPRRLFPKAGLKPKKLHFDKNKSQDTNCSDERVDRSIKSRLRNNASTRITRSSSRGNDSQQANQILQRDASKENKGRLSKDDGRTVTKEHAKSARSISTYSTSEHSTLQELEKCSSVLSQYDDSLSWQEKLLWLQPRRDVGMKIQCCRNSCKKWRYCDDYHDPVDVPRIWYCEMNSDKSIASCFVPEVKNSEEYEYDLIENKYNAGSIVWARTNGYPWWPAMVDDCPDALRYYELKTETSVIPVKYHVIFFNESPFNLRHVWLTCSKLKPFIKHEKDNLVKKTVFCGVDYKEQVEEAHALAQKAIPLSIFQRLQIFSYVSRIKRLHIQDTINEICTSSLGIDIVDQDEDDEVIPVTPTQHVTLEQFHRSFSMKHSTETSESK